MLCLLRLGCATSNSPVELFQQNPTGIPQIMSSRLIHSEPTSPDSSRRGRYLDFPVIRVQFLMICEFSVNIKSDADYMHSLISVSTLSINCECSHFQLFNYVSECAHAAELT